MRTLFRVDIAVCGGHMRETLLAMRFDHHLVRVMVYMDVLSIDHDIVCVSEDLSHFLQRHTLSLRYEDDNEDGAKAGYDDEEEIKLPA